MLDNHALRERNKAIIDGKVVRLVSLQEITSLKLKHNSTQTNSVNIEHKRTETNCKHNVDASTNVISPIKTANTSSGISSSASQPKPSQPKSFFHDVSQLNPAKDLQYVLTGRTNLPDNIGAWLKQMQVVYTNLFARENAEFEEYYLNSTVSETLPILRELPDNRLLGCHQFVAAQNLPKVSIIIPFHNEQYSFLVRTLHSVIDKTPAELIHEIILVDDASDKENLVDAFPEYAKRLPKVSNLSIL